MFGVMCVYLNTGWKVITVEEHHPFETQRCAFTVLLLPAKDNVDFKKRVHIQCTVGSDVSATRYVLHI